LAFVAVLLPLAALVSLEDCSSCGGWDWFALPRTRHARKAKRGRAQIENNFPAQDPCEIQNASQSFFIYNASRIRTNPLLRSGPRPAAPSRAKPIAEIQKKKFQLEPASPKALAPAI
jgi:hypothetical protein